MNRIIILLLIITCPLVKAFSQCTETVTPRVLVIGDSWAAFMLTDSTFSYVLPVWGHSNYGFVSNGLVSVDGWETTDLMKASTESAIVQLLNANPTIDVVHVSIGGNDFLGSWNVNMTQGQIDTLVAGVFVNLDSIFRFLKSCRPGIKILWSGYCYTNFKEVIEDFSDSSAHPYYNTWNGMGKPDFVQINTVQDEISDSVTSYCAQHPGVYYVNSNSYMQYVYGQPSPMDVAPMGTYPPLTAPIPLGYDSYPSPVAAMRNYGLFTDCFHLSKDGFRYMIGYHAQKFYQKLFMDDLYLLSDSNQTGTVSSTGTVSDSLQMGEAGGANFESVLSFNTTSMADTTLEKASLFLRRSSLTGNNPISSNLTVAVKSGYFGTSANVEAADYTATADASGTPCLFGSNVNDGDWIRLDLPSSMYQYINNSATTQFIVSAPGVTGAEVSFYNASNPDFAPVLNLKYGHPTAINDVAGNQPLSVYPNPTTGLITIESPDDIITRVKVTDILGAVVLQPGIQQNTIDISSLPAGMYILNITTKSGITSQKVVKD